MHIRDGKHMFLMEYIENFENRFNCKSYPYLTCGLSFHPKSLLVADSHPPQGLQTTPSPTPVVHVSWQLV
jgi:galactose-1-phosphate uridylyltransferase